MAQLIFLVISVFLLAGIIFFGIRKPGYSHIRDTISELGETGARDEKQVAWLLFFPVGLFLILNALFLTDRNAPVWGLSVCVGIGYIMAALFPCDPGSPSGGSGRQQLHNLGGLIEYGGGIVFIMKAGRGDLSFLFISYQILGYILIVSLILLSIPGNRLRGLVQRIAESLLFLSIIFLSES